MWLQRLKAYGRLMRLDKPIGIFLLLWPTLWALWIASAGRPPLKILVIFVLGTVVMRSAGCVINDIVDRAFDAHVVRTKSRPLVMGLVSIREALALFFVLCLCALLLVLQFNVHTIMLACVALLLAIIYPFMKRYTYWPQVVLGAAFSCAIPMAFTAVQVSQQRLFTLLLPAGLLFVTAIIWTVAYDTMYAMVDREDDRKIGIKSTALLFGHFDRFWIGVAQVLVLLLLTYLGVFLRLGLFYFAALIVAAGVACYQQCLIKTREPARCFRAFLNNNVFGLVIFLGILLSYR